MIKVEFKQEYRGVIDIVCNHISTFKMEDITMLQLHFTKDIFWGINPELVKHISQSEQKPL